MPFGTAHETPTPSFSNRRSQCSRRAWCSWTTKRSARGAFFGTRAPGSGVFLKSLLALYSASLVVATRKRLGHGRLGLGSADFDLGLLRGADEHRGRCAQDEN